MKDLWGRTTALFWEHPILWLPVLAADLFGFTIQQIQQLISHRIVSWLIQHNPASVFGGAPDRGQMTALTFKAALLTAPLTWGSYFITILAYTMALAVISDLVRQMLQGHEPDLRSQSAGLATKAMAGLGLAGKVLGLCLIAGLALMVVPVLGVARLPLWVFASVTALLGAAAVALFSAPLVLRFLQGAGTPIPTNATTYARIAAIATVGCSLLLSLFCTQAENSISTLRYQGHAIARSATQASASLIAAFPYILLFIFLALVAFDVGDVAEQIEEPSPLPDNPDAIT